VRAVAEGDLVVLENHAVSVPMTACHWRSRSPRDGLRASPFFAVTPAPGFRFPRETVAKSPSTGPWNDRLSW